MKFGPGNKVLLPGPLPAGQPEAAPVRREELVRRTGGFDGIDCREVGISTTPNDRQTSVGE